MLRVFMAAPVVVLSLAVVSIDAPGLGRRDEPLRRLFTPLHAPAGTFEAYVTGEPIDRVARRLAQLNPSPQSGASWIIRRVDVSEAFGSASRFDRYQVLRLYGGIRPRLARGPILQDGRVVASATLISPFPDSSLEHLQIGTLIVLLRLEPGGST